MYKYYLLKNIESNEIFFYKIKYKEFFNFYNDLNILNSNLLFITDSDKMSIDIKEYIKINNFYKMIIIIELLKEMCLNKKNLELKEYLLTEDLSKEDFIKKYI